MIWSVETDDFRGLCGEKYPLLKTLNYVLRDGKPPLPTKPAPTTSPVPTTPSPAPGQPQPTTTQKPKGPQPAPNGVCKAEGFNRDPERCEVFYYCQVNNGKFEVFQFECPDSLVFDVRTNNCNYKKFVNC